MGQIEDQSRSIGREHCLGMAEGAGIADDFPEKAPVTGANPFHDTQPETLHEQFPPQSH